MSILEMVPRPGQRIQGTSPAAYEVAGLLTARELVVLANLSEGVTLEEIATKLWVTRNTVKSQVRSLYRKIGVRTRADAVSWAQQAGLR